MKWMLILICGLCGCSSGTSEKCGNHLDLYTTDGSRVGSFNNVETRYLSTGKVGFTSNGVDFIWSGTYLYYQVCGE